LHGGLSQARHAEGHRALADLGRWFSIQDHFLDLIREVQELGDALTTAIPGPVAVLAPTALGQRDLTILVIVELRLLGLRAIQPDLFPAGWTDRPHQPLIAAYSEVVLPLPVGPVTSTIP